jgi:glycosyltransferase involved in cell wall biosynthesis
MTDQSDLVRRSGAPRVSVTVPTFNHGRWLAECLESVVRQEVNFTYEIIVADDASTDGITPAIVAEYAARYPNLIVPLLREKNMGPGQNFLDLIRHARGEYIAHCDGDDLMLPGKLQRQVDFLDRNPDCAYVTHNMRIIDGETGRVIAERFLNRPIPAKSDIDFLCLVGAFFSHSSKMYRASAIVTRVRDRRMIDFHHHVEHASRGSIGYIDETLGVYRKVRGSASDVNGARALEMERSFLEAFDRAQELGVSPDVVNRGRARYRYSQAIVYLRAGRLVEFRQRIRLDRELRRYASPKHRLLARVAGQPWILRFILGFK